MECWIQPAWHGFAVLLLGLWWAVLYRYEHSLDRYRNELDRLALIQIEEFRTLPRSGGRDG